MGRRPARWQFLASRTTDRECDSTADRDQADPRRGPGGELSAREYRSRPGPVRMSSGFGIRLARLRSSTSARPNRPRTCGIEWKQSPTGLWYVRSIDKTDVFHDPRIPVQRIRHVLKYTEFQPNAKVDPKLFLQAALYFVQEPDPGPNAPGPRFPFAGCPDPFLSDSAMDPPGEVGSRPMIVGRSRRLLSSKGGGISLSRAAPT